MAARLPWFLAGEPDVLGLLDEQAKVTVEGMRAFASWSSGGADEGQKVRDCEHGADAARRALAEALRTVLVSPLEPEDLYTMSERLDVVVNGAKNVVRDAEALGWQPDEAAAAMAALLLEGTEHLAAAIACIKSDADEASQRADAATKTARKVERGYRDAMVVLRNRPEGGALALMTAYEAYGRYLAIGDAIVGVAHRIWYAVLKTA
jgi:uncharacterized protein Yka (UPF0111/DUF47 family)